MQKQGPETDDTWILPLVGFLIAALIAFGLGYWIAEDSYYSKQERYQRYLHTEGKSSAANPVLVGKGNPATLEYREPCKRPQGREESELCAQWRAARAGEAGALWTQRGVLASLGGGLLTLVSIFLVLRALAHAREANVIARNMARLDLRAYLDFESVRLAPVSKHPVAKGMEYIGAKVSLRNFGKTPAENINVLASYSLSTDQGIMPLTDHDKTGVGGLTPTDIHHWQDYTAYWEGTRDRILSGECRLQLSITVHYDDMFDQGHILSSVYQSSIEDDCEFGFVIGTRINK